MATFSYNAFREKTRDGDPDIRVMALFDLVQELQREGAHLDEPSQKIAAECVLQLLSSDTSSDVQGMVVKCMPHLVRKVKESLVEKLVSDLCELCLKTDKEKDRRDVASIALKTVVEQIPADFVTPVKVLTKPLVAGIERAPDKVEVLDVLNDIVKRFGPVVSEEHDQLQSLLMREIATKDSPNHTARKKAIICLASLCVYSNDTLFATTVKTILDGIRTPDTTQLRKYIQLCSAVSRTAGQRLGKSLGDIVPILLEHAKPPEESMDDDAIGDDEAEEVRENIIQALESFALRCPQQVSQFFPQIVELCKFYLQWDPNYSYDDDEEMDEDVEDEDMEDMDDGDMEGDDDDDDTSWKVRKASSKCLTALIISRPDQLEFMYRNLCSQENVLLPDRFKEREESVRLDIFKLFNTLLSSTTVKDCADDREANSSASTSFFLKATATAEANYLKQEAVKKKIVSGLIKCLKDKSPKTKIGCFQLLKELCIVIGPALKTDVPALVGAISAALADRSINYTLKTEVLTFLRLLIHANPEAFAQHVNALTPAVYACVQDRYYKICAEALRVCGELVRVVSIMSDAPAQTQKLYGCVFQRLSVQDVDQDVKEAAIVTMGRILAEAKQHLAADDINKSQEILLGLLRNEMTRVITTRTVSTIKDVPTPPAICNAYTTELAQFLRKNSRQLRQAALVTLRDLVVAQGKNIEQANFLALLDEVKVLLTDQDLHLSYLALTLCSAVVSTQPTMAQPLEQRVLDNAIGLLRSPLLQGHALEALLDMFGRLAEVTSLGYQKLLARVTDAATDAAARQVYQSVAQVVAAVVSSVGGDQAAQSVAQFGQDLKSPEPRKTILALHCIGEVGRQTALPNVSQTVKVIRELFTSENEEIKTVAPLALGRLSAGNLQEYLPPLLAELKQPTDARYLLLRSLKEIVAVSFSTSAGSLADYVPDVLPLLFQFAESEEEGVRNVTAECLGKLGLLEPSLVVPAIKDHMEGSAADAKRATMVTALKYTITEQDQQIDKFLKDELKGFLKNALDKKHHVSIRRAGILLFTAVAHHKPALVRADLDFYMQALYAETPLDKQLIRTLNLGPFNHRVDDGLELRKAAFECMDILLDNVGPSSLLEFQNDYPKFIEHLVKYGLTDEDMDIRMLAHVMVCKLCKIPNAVIPMLNLLDDAATNMAATVKKKPGKNAVPQEVARHNDMLRSCLKAVVVLGKLNGANDHTKFTELINMSIGAEKEVKAMYDAELAAGQE